MGSKAWPLLPFRLSLDCRAPPGSSPLCRLWSPSSMLKSSHRVELALCPHHPPLLTACSSPFPARIPWPYPNIPGSLSSFLRRSTTQSASSPALFLLSFYHPRTLLLGPLCWVIFLHPNLGAFRDSNLGPLLGSPYICSLETHAHPVPKGPSTSQLSSPPTPIS